MLKIVTDMAITIQVNIKNISGVNVEYLSFSTGEVELITYIKGMQLEVRSITFINRDLEVYITMAIKI